MEGFFFILEEFFLSFYKEGKEDEAEGLLFPSVHYQNVQNKMKSEMAL